jgi:hypothetical protein
MAKQEAPKITPVYLKSADNTWIPALQLKVHDGKATVKVPKFKNEKDMMNCGKESKTCPYHEHQIVDLKDYPNGLLPMQNVDSNGNLEEYKDMVDLPFMHEVRANGAWNSKARTRFARASRFSLHTCKLETRALRALRCMY